MWNKVNFIKIHKNQPNFEKDLIFIKSAKKLNSNLISEQFEDTFTIFLSKKKLIIQNFYRIFKKKFKDIFFKLCPWIFIPWTKIMHYIIFKILPGLVDTEIIFQTAKELLTI